MNLSTAIKSVREGSGQTQQDLAQRLSVTHSMISKYEKGQATPSFPILFSLLTLCADKQNDERQAILTSMADSLGTNLEGVVKIIKNVHEQKQEISTWRAVVKRLSGDDEGLALAISDSRVQAVIEYYVDFREQPAMDAHLTDAVMSLHRARRLAADAKFGDLSEKEVEQLEDLLYLIRRGDSREVRDLTRRAAAFRRQVEESERKDTSEVKKQHRGRR